MKGPGKKGDSPPWSSGVVGCQREQRWPEQRWPETGKMTRASELARRVWVLSSSSRIPTVVPEGE